MKQLVVTYFLIVFLIHAYDVHAQGEYAGQLPLIDGNIRYEKVLEIAPKELDEHAKSVMEWMSDEGFAALGTIQKTDDRFIIRSSGQMDCLWGPNDFRELYKEIRFTLELVVKSDRLQYSFGDFMVQDQTSTYHLEIYKMEDNRDLKYTSAMHREIDAKIRAYIESLQLKMN